MYVCSRLCVFVCLYLSVNSLFCLVGVFGWGFWMPRVHRSIAGS